MFSFFKKREEVKGYIALHGLKEWWYSSFTDAEQLYINETFQPLGAPRNVLTTGDYSPSEDARTLSFLSSLSSWFNNSRERRLAYLILEKAEEFLASEKRILDVHFFYQTKIELFYKDREDPEKLSVAINACMKQIDIAEIAAEAFEREFNDPILPMHIGYKQICIIFEKKKDYSKVIWFASKALKQGWNGNWQRRLEKASKYI